MATDITVTTNNHITSLSTLIASSVQEVLAIYASVGQAAPSLDSVEPGPFDDAVEDVPERLVRAVKVIKAACAQLVCTVSNPSGIILDKALAQPEPSCLVIVTNARIADLLVDKPEGMHVKQLAEASGFNDSDKLGRVMRLLATNHVFREVKPGVYANNRLSIKLISKNTMSDMVNMLTDETRLAAAHAYETFSTKPKFPDETAFQRLTGHKIFDWYNLPENKEKAERFNRAMVAGIEYHGSFLSKAYPWMEHPSERTVCDVGGGNGHNMMDLLKKHPNLKAVLQDQPEVIEQAKKYWTKEYPQAIEEKRVQFAPLNFFTDQAVEGCDVYYIKHIIHDWPDDRCLTILQNIRKAMKPEARLVIHELAIPSPARYVQCPEDRAPEPLLPNWGAPTARAYNVDFAMMTSFGSKERTLEEMISLCEMCGLQFRKLYPAGETDLMEFIPA
ncbi:S-adenosyl-L-methionine-dependent methyltransferase [Moniliophthora roreri MCA 2997]|uniref:S-adenosyl-L-methionine-dependent methyltransferase n=2 Tax=Moniliophthora roreri TaxID=221103 RepID=V2Y0B3_MONRO|nr:S-adenosyl-L-methionine-dependent methyltransferase [Moniliophthora roreri MCA 2997]KAI3616384.1 S-adenosyl-L-methionine-dependent methyltransferase [Moniliophthora roreri]